MNLFGQFDGEFVDVQGGVVTVGAVVVDGEIRMCIIVIKCIIIIIMFFIKFIKFMFIITITIDSAPFALRKDARIIYSATATTTGGEAALRRSPHNIPHIQHNFGIVVRVGQFRLF